MHGYELIGALEERTNGAWKPSAGAMYPALVRLEHKGLIEPVATETDGETRAFQLTDDGRKQVAIMADAGLTEPWTELSESAGGDLRRQMAELVGPLRQIGRFGQPEQVAAAQKVIAEATASLYRILADGADSTTRDPNERT